MDIQHRITGDVFFVTDTVVDWVDIFSRPIYKHILSSGTVDMAYNDMKNNPDYREIKNLNQLITDVNELRNLPMYKVNENFITIARDNGYTILNIGNPLNLSESLFFNMEKIKMGF